MRPQARHANANADTRQTNVKLDDGPPKVGAIIMSQIVFDVLLYLYWITYKYQILTMKIVDYSL